MNIESNNSISQFRSQNNIFQKLSQEVDGKAFEKIFANSTNTADFTIDSNMAVPVEIKYKLDATKIDFLFEEVKIRDQVQFTITDPYGNRQAEEASFKSFHNTEGYPYIYLTMNIELRNGMKLVCDSLEVRSPSMFVERRLEFRGKIKEIIKSKM